MHDESIYFQMKKHTPTLKVCLIIQCFTKKFPDLKLQLHSSTPQLR